MAGNRSCVKGDVDSGTVLIWLETEAVSREISEIARDGPQYYDQKLQMLKFPVLVHPLGPLYGDSPPLVLEVFALLTCPSAIVLTPGSLDFGRVTTLETVTASVRLTNRSLAAQYYGFLRLPKGVSVQPGHGFGYVLPQHTVPLVVLYSPCPMDIQGNVTGQNGLNGTHIFTLRCATVAASLTTPHRCEGRELI
uniref:CFAP74 fourth Ig-like domain-containing protein n=1 Tax=Timema poppense TaxID=170557 RepID=A0A7R9HGI6_TIMPO|nr:unnamed protein product [Timema poppensis]